MNFRRILVAALNGKNFPENLLLQASGSVFGAKASELKSKSFDRPEKP